MIEMEKLEDFESNIYDTMYNLSIDVMDKISLNSSFSGEWNENKFIFDNVDWKLDDFENKLIALKQKESWDKFIPNQQIILVTGYLLNSPNVEKILPDAIIIFLENKYLGDEKDLSKMKDKNIFYYGSNPDRFIRYFGKFGLAIKL